MAITDQFVLHYREEAEKFKSLPHSKQRKLYKALKALQINKRSAFEKYAKIFELVQDPDEKIVKVFDNPKGDRLSQIFSGFNFEVDKKGRNFLTEHSQKEHLVAVLFWFVYFYPQEAKQFCEEIDLEFMPIERHPILSGSPKVTFDHLGLVIPSANKRDDVRLKIHFAIEAVQFTGRDAEKKELYEFLEEAEGTKFKWWQLSGQAGQGKSRLALQLLLEITSGTSESNWDAGFVQNFDDDFLAKIKNWQPQKNTLIIIDYASSPAKTDRLLNVIDYLHHLGLATNRVGSKIRLLVLDRQPYGAEVPEDKKRHLSEESSNWQFRVFKQISDDVRQTSAIESCFLTESPLRLDSPSNEELMQIALGWAKYRCAGQNSDVDAPALSFQQKKMVEEHLGLADDFADSNRKRPLIAILVTEAILSPDFQDNHFSKLEHLLEFVLEKDIQKMFFEHDIDRLKSADEIIRHQNADAPYCVSLAILANIVSAFDAKIDLPDLRIGQYELFPRRPQDIDFARKMLGYSTHLESKNSFYFTKREPDLLGEYQVLFETRKLSKNVIDSIIKTSWTLNRENTFTFFQHLIQDFPNNLYVARLLKIPTLDVEFRSDLFELQLTAIETANPFSVGAAVFEQVKELAIDNSLSGPVQLHYIKCLFSHNRELWDRGSFEPFPSFISEMANFLTQYGSDEAFREVIGWAFSVQAIRYLNAGDIDKSDRCLVHLDELLESYPGHERLIDILAFSLKERAVAFYSNEGFRGAEEVIQQLEDVSKTFPQRKQIAVVHAEALFYLVVYSRQFKRNDEFDTYWSKFNELLGSNFDNDSVREWFSSAEYALDYMSRSDAVLENIYSVKD